MIRLDDLLTRRVVDKLFPGNYGSEMDSVHRIFVVFIAELFCYMKKSAVTWKIDGRKPGMELYQNIVGNIMIGDLLFDDSVKQPDVWTHTTGSSCIDDQIRVKMIDQDLCGDRGIDFAYSAE